MQIFQFVFVNWDINKLTYIHKNENHSIYVLIIDYMLKTKKHNFGQTHEQ